MGTKVKLTPAEITEKWKRRTTAAIPDIVKGIDRVTESPAQKAIAKQDKMKANLIKSLDDGTWAKRLGKVTLEEWKAKTSAKVQERMAGGVAAATEKREKFDNWLATRLNTLMPTVAKMPDLTIDDSIAKVAYMMRGMAEKPYKKTG